MIGAQRPQLLAEALSALERGDPLTGPYRDAVVTSLREQLRRPHVFRRSGTGWIVGDGIKECHFSGRLKGFAAIHWLLKYEGQEVLALELVRENVFCEHRPHSGPTVDGGERENDEGGETEGGESVEEKETMPMGWFSQQPVLDAKTMIECENRIEQISELLSMTAQDSPEYLELLSEMEQIQDYRDKATHNGGRPRMFATWNDNARRAVQKQIRRAITKLEGEGLQEMANHLDYCIKTGYAVTYKQNGKRIKWEL